MNKRAVSIFSHLFMEMFTKMENSTKCQCQTLKSMAGNYRGLHGDMREMTL